jgi:hypothetical protein
MHVVHAEVATGSGSAEDATGEVIATANTAYGTGSTSGHVIRIPGIAQPAQAEGEAFDATIVWDDDEFVIALLAA